MRQSSTFFFILNCCVLITLTDGFSLSNCTIYFPFEYSGHLKVLCSRMSYRKIPSPLPHNTVNLDISYNAIHQIVEGDFIRLSNLIILNISHNRISEIHSNALSDLANLEELNLSNNKIKTVTTKLLNGLANLSHLRLDSNYLETTENHQEELQSPPFILLSELRVLKINSQRRGLNYIPSNFLKGLKNLQVFYAGNLNIENLHVDTFSYTLNLTFLDLASNNLANRNITLGRTHLKSLDFLVDANLSMLDLQNNSFTCDCSNAWFIDWAVKNNKTQVLYLNMYECRYPLSLSGKSLAAFNTESCNVNYDFICFVYSSSIVILTLVISFIYHFLKWQLVYAYYLFLAFLNDKKRKRTSNHLDFQYDAFISYSAQEEPWVLEELDQTAGVAGLKGSYALNTHLEIQGHVK
uniref:LRRCT domain-containing protein n=1 Tax=Sinocyclocheilus rhinocerous TaxID=307959 RepID=A0A673IZM8_9TELE